MFKNKYSRLSPPADAAAATTAEANGEMGGLAPCMEAGLCLVVCLGCLLWQGCAFVASSVDLADSFERIQNEITLWLSCLHLGTYRRTY